MCGNSIGRLFKITTFGESHGEAIGVIIDGCPPGVPLTEEIINAALEKRRSCGADFSTSRQEPDRALIISGLFNGKTTGAPLTVIIENRDARPEDYETVSEYFRPGHADFTYYHKYKGFNDPCGGGRASGRETACRVAAGAMAREILAPLKIDLFAHTVQIGSVKTTVFERTAVEASPLKCADKGAEEKMLRLIDECKAMGDSIGGAIELRIMNLPIGVGEPVFDKLDARLAYAIMGVPAVKGVDIGEGFAATSAKGSENNDQMADSAFLSNYAGGIQGGISNGQPVLLRAAVKPASSIAKTQRTITKAGENVEINIPGRHDVCIVPRAVPVIEAMAWITLADFAMIGGLLP